MEEKNEIIGKTKMREIKKISPIEMEDFEEFNYEWTLPRGKQIIVRIRKKGSKLAGHYHKGEDPSKKPEKFFLAEGKMKVTLIDQEENKEFITLEQGHSLMIPPFIAHQFEAIEDIILLEYRITPFNREKQDIHYLPDLFE